MRTIRSDWSLIVADTDFLGAFIKIAELDIVLQELEVDRVLTPVQVREELMEEFETVPEDRVEFREVEPIEDEELGRGERAAIALTSRDDLLLMNDRKACRKASELGLKTVTIPGFLMNLGEEDAGRIAQKLRKQDDYRFSETEREKLGL